MKRFQFIKGLIAATVVSALPRQKSTVYQKIYLLQCFVAGFRYYTGKNILSKFRIGDMLTMKREADNKYDKNAIALYWNDAKIGFIPAQENTLLSRLLDADSVKLIAEITHIEKDAQLWESIAIAVSQLKEIEHSDALKNSIPEYLTVLETPEYETLPDNVAGEKERDLGRLLEADEVIFKVSEVPNWLSEAEKSGFEYCPKFWIANEEYYSVTTDHIHTLTYSVCGGQYLRDNDGKIRLQGFFNGEDSFAG